MKGAVGFASLLFCVLALLAVAGLRDPQQPVPNTAGVKPEELNTLVEERVKQRAEELKIKNPAVAVAPPVKEDPGKKTIHRSRSMRTQVTATRRPLTKQERLQLAADLRLTGLTEETDLDLLSDRLNRQDD
jgi:hypothetical protein